MRGPGLDGNLYWGLTMSTAACIPSRPLNVALVNMPWARCDAPSIQCGLLKAALTAYGHHVDVHYPNLALSEKMGPELYRSISNLPDERHMMLGDWLFTGSAYGRGGYPYPASEYLSHYRSSLRSLSSETLLALHEDILPDWIDDQVASVAWADYDIVGFTSTFAQNLAAIALARRISELPGHPLLIFGGANFDGDMGPEYVRAFPAVECAIRGEGEIALPMVAASVSRGEPISDIPGVICRGEQGDLVSNGSALKPRDMDDVPTPDYSDYFARLGRGDLAAVIGEDSPVLLFETSRGCWWGEKHHCTFCGLNAESMAFRSKSPGRVLSELREMVSRYKCLTALAVDNIMDMKYLNTLCVKLAEEKWDLRIFFEVKANLTRDQLRTLSASGIVHIQPGIESLSSNVLRLMRKGSTMLTNISLLKWCSYYGIHVDWNILAGFPGEEDADYEQQIRLVPRLTHLMPPAGVVRVWLERFSPYYEGSTAFSDIRPKDSYRFAYPADDLDIGKIAYFFDYRADRTLSDEVLGRLERAVDRWRDNWNSAPRPALTYRRGPDWLSIYDSRTSKPRKIDIAGWRAEVFEYCSDKPHSLSRITEFLDSSSEKTVNDDQLRSFLELCITEFLMISENGHFFSLPVPVNPNW